MINYKILLNFIKDASIETPNAETLMFVKENISKYHLNIDINSKALKNKMVEVNTKMSFRDKENSEKQSVFEINYASVVSIDENIRDPIAPDIVLFGLIFDNFGPFKIFPNINPPISEAIHVIKITKINIFKCKKDEKIKKIIQKVKIYVL